MTSHGHDHADDHGDAHALDLEPATTLSPGEPSTPGWVPAVGLALLLSSAVYLLVSNRDDTGAVKGEAAPTKPTPAAVAPAAPSPQPGTAQRGTSAGAGQQQPIPLSPEQLATARKRLEDASKRGALPPPPGGQPGAGSARTAPTAGH
jgi:hypothetical protein